MLTEYYFLDDHFRIIEGWELADDEAAEKVGLDIAKRTGKIVRVMKRVCTVGPIED